MGIFRQIQDPVPQIMFGKFHCSHLVIPESEAVVVTHHKGAITAAQQGCYLVGQKTLLTGVTAGVSADDFVNALGGSLPKNHFPIQEKISRPEFHQTILVASGLHAKFRVKIFGGKNAGYVDAAISIRLA